MDSPRARGYAACTTTKHHHRAEYRANGDDKNLPVSNSKPELTTRCKMRRPTIARGATPAQPIENRIGRSFSASEFSVKKPPRSEKSANATLGEGSSTLDDVSFLRLPEVKAITGLSKTSVYALIKERTFPAPVRLGPRAVAWVRSEVRQWALERVHASRSVA